jgi:transposase
MYIDDCKYRRNNRSYRRVLLRESYRQKGKVYHNTIANLSKCSDQELEAIRIGLKYKKNISFLEHLKEGRSSNGKIIGTVSALYQIAHRLGIAQVLGKTDQGLFILWLIIARIIDQGSRLSAVRLARVHAGCEIIGIGSINEDKLYEAMDWLYDNREAIEKKLFRKWKKNQGDGDGDSDGDSEKNQHIFLYDISSSYLEGEKNEFAMFGYNRDKKKGKKQVIYGLLTDEEGEPLSIEVFPGSTKDNKTVSSQVEKIKKKFGCQYITIVGDKGMIKIAQMKEINDENYYYITTVTKPQIESLVKKNKLQMGLFDDKLFEVEMEIEEKQDTDTDTGKKDAGNAGNAGAGQGKGKESKKIRYILRRNPYRANEMKINRQSKITAIEKRMNQSNQYLREHKGAQVEVQKRELIKYVQKLKLTGIVILEEVANKKELELKIDQRELEEKSQLDGCYVIKTDLPKRAADKELIHERYKALAEVEMGFRTMKSFLEARPIYVRKAEKTVAHFEIVMLAYKIERYLRNAWSDLDLTVHEGIEHLSKISSVITEIGNTKLINVPKPEEKIEMLLNRIHVTLPEILPYKEVGVVTRNQLVERRKTR